MAGMHRTPGTPSPTVNQRRVVTWGPLVLMAIVAVWTMATLPGLSAAADIASGAASTTLATGGAVAAAQPGTTGQATVLRSRARVLGQVGPVLAGASATPATVAAVQGCHRQILAGEAVARAGAATYGDWVRHVQVQLDLDAGRATWLGAVQSWSATRFHGRGDPAAFAQAVRLRAATGSGCAVLASEATGALRQTATRCVARAAALDRVGAASALLTGDWARHLATTTTEAAHAPGGPQAGPWLVAAAAAVPRLSAYRAARNALASAPPCAL
jgi:hypothetical protein